MSTDECTSAGPKKKPMARPKAFEVLATAVAVLLSRTGNQVCESSAGAASKKGAATRASVKKAARKRPA